jgi:RNA-binding protein NOB1
MTSTLKAKTLVVDTNAFIKQVRMETIGEEFYTIPQVISEVRDPRAREFLKNYPFEIKTREPTPVALKAVAAFARKSGDYPFLSAVDLRVLALVYTLESEAKGTTSHLRTEPLKLGTSLATAASDNKKNEEEKEEDEEEEEKEGEEEKDDTETTTDNNNNNKENDQPSTSNNDNIKTDSTTATTDSQDTTPQTDQHKEEDDDTKEAVDDDDGGWITSDNIAKLKAKRGQEEDVLVSEEVQVGCFTTDFAMQSVLLQMGLKLLSVEGMVIKKIRQFVFKCHSCFKICKDMTRKFCPSCGNTTLLRFSASTDDQGNLVYTQAQRLHNRGTIFSIPLPRGGRNSKDLVLTEDVYLAKTKYKRDKKDADVFSSEYSFAQGKTGPSDRVVIGYGNKNPNIAKRRIGKKNKPISTL